MSEQILASFGDHAADVRAMAGANARFRRGLIELSSGQFHLLGFCLAWRSQVARGQPDLDWLADMIIRSKPKAVIVAVAGACPDGLLGCLAKLPGPFMADGDYLLLFRLLREPRAARVLWHVDRIGPHLLQLLDGLDPMLRHRRFLAFVQTPKALAAIEYLVAAVISLRPADGRGEVIASLASVSSARSLEAWFNRWLERAPFPLPPWPGTASLHPISSTAELHSAAQRFQNCLKQRLLSVIAGRSYFYVWTEAPMMIAELVRDPSTGWRLGDIGGVANAKPPPELARCIAETFTAAGIGKRPEFWHWPAHVNPIYWSSVTWPDVF